MTEAPGDITWAKIDGRSPWLPRLATWLIPGQLLAKHRGVSNRRPVPTLTIDQILAWADAHHAAHGRWPTITSGPVPAEPGLTWMRH